MACCMGAAFALGLSACGGGGGGAEGGQTATAPPASADSSAPAAGGSPQAVPVELRGLVTYDDVPSTQGRLDYARTVARPVRGATLEVLAEGGSVVLASTETDAQGQYQVSLPGRAAVRLRVKAELKSSGAAATRVVDNTQGDALYAIESPVFDTAGGRQDLHASSGWAGKAYGAPRAAAPFNILDTVYATRQALLQAAPAAVLPPLQVHWSVHNRPAKGAAADGDIATSHFAPSDDGIGRVYLLGRADVDTDEYDDSVIAHEWAHYYQWAFSRDDSIGGSHDGRPLEMSVAFSEGWATAWAAFVTGFEEASDAQGPGQADGYSRRLSAPPAYAPGWYNEDSIAQVLWKLLGAQGMEPVHRAMQALRDARAFSTIHAFSAALRQAAPAVADAFDVFLQGQGIVASAQSDAWGQGETSSGELPPEGFLPVYKLLTPSAPALACLSDAYGNHNKHGNHAYLRLEVPSAGNWRLRAVALFAQGRTGPKNSFTPIMSYLQGGARSWYGLLPAETAGVSTRALVLVLTAGTHAVSLTDAAMLQPSDTLVQCYRMELEPI